MNKIEDMVAQAIGDPGSMVPRAGDDETVTRWATRAVLEVLQDDLRDMTRAVEFGAQLLRTELGPGGLMSEELDTVRKIWSLAIDCLESAATVPMIPLFFWRERKAKENPPARRAGIATLTEASAPDACAHCEGLEGTHTLRDCAGYLAATYPPAGAR